MKFKVYLLYISIFIITIINSENCAKNPNIPKTVWQYSSSYNIDHLQRLPSNNCYMSISIKDSMSIIELVDSLGKKIVNYKLNDTIVKGILDKKRNLIYLRPYKTSGLSELVYRNKKKKVLWTKSIPIEINQACLHTNINCNRIAVSGNRSDKGLIIVFSSKGERIYKIESEKPIVNCSFSLSHDQLVVAYHDKRIVLYKNGQLVNRKKYNNEILKVIFNDFDGTFIVSLKNGEIFRGFSPYPLIHYPKPYLQARGVGENGYAIICRDEILRYNQSGKSQVDACNDWRNILPQKKFIFDKNMTFSNNLDALVIVKEKKLLCYSRYLKKKK